ncbi:glycoside hydrolase family 3 C-terminal domain-containing protein [Acetobacteraceae bacterium KSS8]|uniref:Glycoside hydrolase family 3 C-terminal domain-containing protein n=1 Tax=Endosaccharibacter trunci TaxID=2812733 RepID=A0ABT1W640_9PROT|nr:glycoside hydrolase family 3 C-terminal domain-containing protein [Acetobacteraceae bacterium KSS8]
MAGPIGNPAACPWLNPGLSVGARVDMLLAHMTVADEIALVQGNGSNEPYVFYTAPNPKLCLPGIGYEDGPAGAADGLTNVTQFPAGIALAATFSKTDALIYGITLGAEQSAKGSGADLGPTVNIDRDPRWGRTFESLSEDPALTAGIGAAEIEGIQSQRVMAQVKHFDAYNQETNRNTQAEDDIVSERTLHEIYQLAFRAAINDAGAGSLMCAYSSVNGFYSCESRSLLTGVLRNELNFKGLVMSDYGAVHDLSAATAGTDSEQPENTYFGAPLQAAVENGPISRAVLNAQVEPILYEMFRFNFFNDPPQGTTSAIATTPDHVATSNALAEAGSVLLKNRNALLPLKPGADIVVIGPAASAQVTSSGGGSAHVLPGPVVSPLQGIQAASTGSIAYQQGLPTDAQLTPIPSADLSTPYAPTNYGGSYSATLTPTESGLYIIGFNNPGSYNVASLTINGTTIINNPGTPPVSTYSAAIQLVAGRKYSLTLGGAGPTSSLVWATPSTLQSYVAPAVAAARAAKTAVVVVADDTESEAADRPNLSLPSAQDALIQAVEAVNPRTVVVVQAGAPITMPWLDGVGAVLDTWYPGQTGGTALADLLYGKTNPGGHLPITFPTSLSAIPTASPAQFPGQNNTVEYSEGLLVGYRWYDQNKVKPLFPFGYGLSYTSFKYSDLRVESGTVDGVTPVHVSATVTNTGKVAGSDAAQLYLGYPSAAGEPPRKLVDFQRVTLAPGESKRLSFTIRPSDEWWWNGNGWDETTGTYKVWVGDSSALADLPLTGSYAMDRGIGHRRVSVSAPRTFTAGASDTAVVTLSADGDQTLAGVDLSLAAPDGWRVQPTTATHFTNVPAGQRLSVAFRLTPPAGAVTRDVTLFGTADFASNGCYRVIDAQTTGPAQLARDAALGREGCKPAARHGGVQARLLK